MGQIKHVSDGIVVDKLFLGDNTITSDLDYKLHHISSLDITSVDEFDICCNYPATTSTSGIVQANVIRIDIPKFIGKLHSITLLLGNNLSANGIPTNTPLYILLWKEENGSNVLLGCSKEANNPYNNTGQLHTWEFDDIDINSNIFITFDTNKTWSNNYANRIYIKNTTVEYDGNNWKVKRTSDTELKTNWTPVCQVIYRQEAEFDISHNALRWQVNSLANELEDVKTILNNILNDNNTSLSLTENILS